ncbi:hypothetical protein CLV68_3038 [Actinokineospora cianjurensis]|uniref:Uncharacterized protein n=1 Tax=Actinokineospora cianjurensis TaxID=585224 RepID=A0A421B2H0_9PSEU|nr:hypothetical protein CLV68_3038 [Actinokineospora cianjurensis]
MTVRVDDIDWGEKIQVSTLGIATVDWHKAGVEPRWFGAETAGCVAVLEPGIHSGFTTERSRVNSASPALP